MKHRWTTLLWELWAAQALCAVAALPPGQCVHYMPGTGAALGWPLRLAVPTAMGCVGAAGRAARRPAAGAASGAGTGVRFCHPVRF